MKALITAVTLLLLSNSALVHAQDTSNIGLEQESAKLSQADMKALTDARIAIVKAALQLKPEQEKYWPAIEEAVRSRAEARQQRMAALDEVENQKDVDPFKLLSMRADALAQKGAALKKLADAWQPLYASLDADQKRRLGSVAVRVLPAIRDAFDTRPNAMYDEFDEDTE